MSYGLTTYKSDGTTVVLTNSTKSGVYGKFVTVAPVGTAGYQTTITFPEYTGRTIRPIQLKPGQHTWYSIVVDNVPRIVFTEYDQLAAVAGLSFYEDTVLHIFVK